VPLPVRPIRPRHTRTRIVHTQITRIADFERLQRDGTLSRRDSLSARESGWRVLAAMRQIFVEIRANGGIHNIDERIVWVEEFSIYSG
jgi:hypothetical protein